MRNYWSCTDFADWLRGTPKPGAETSRGWAQWRVASKEAHPFRYWLAEEGLDSIQNFLMWPIDKLYGIKYYINNRWVTKTHALTASPADISRGEWRDVGNRFLPCLFNELVDFVEIELAWWNICWADKEKRQKYEAPFWATGWFRWRTWRCPQSGLDNLEWQRNLTNDDTWFEKDDPRIGEPTPQAIKAQEILDLYNWWKTERPARPDPYEVSGWSAICANRRKNYPNEFLAEDRSDEERAESRKALDICNELEAAYEQEDEDMMIRLIKVRHGLWT